MLSIEAHGRKASAVALALVLGVPGLLLIGQAVGVLALGSAGVNVLWRAERLNLSEAVVLRDLAEAARLIEEGADVNAPLPIRKGGFADANVVLTPIEAAVAGDRPNAFDLLLARGAHLEPSALPRLMCLARRAESEEMLARLRDISDDVPDCHDVALPW
jgi:hypothetical protein